MNFRSLLLLLLAVLLPAACSREMPEPARIHSLPVQGVRILDDRLLYVCFDEATTARIERGEADFPHLGRVFPEAGVYEPRTRREGLHRWYYVPGGVRTKSDWAAMEGVEYVEETPLCARQGFFNDPLLDRQWHYVNEGRSGGAKGIDIRVEEVWRRYTCGRPEVIVAVVDGGIDPAHVDLTGNLWQEGSWNFVDQSAQLTAHTHGTHIGGTIGAVSGNGIGVSGIAGGNAAQGQRGVRLLNCQVYKTIMKNGVQADTSARIPQAIKWAADHGAVICNNSWGYYFDDNDDGVLDEKEMARAMNTEITRADKLAIDYFIKYAGCDNDGRQLAPSPMKGGLVLFAAGNYDIGNGIPANYAPVLAVAAVDSVGKKAAFSNYGPYVDLAAPGTRIASTSINNRYSFLNGTSMSCAVVSGVAALLVSYFGGPGFTPDKLREKLLGGSRPLPDAAQCGRLVDALGAFEFEVPEKIPVWPNPVRDTLCLDFGIPGQQGHAVLHASSGARVLDCRLQSDGEGIARLGLRHLAPGRYLLHISQGDRDIRTPLVKR